MRLQILSLSFVHSTIRPALEIMYAYYRAGLLVRLDSLAVSVSTGRNPTRMGSGPARLEADADREFPSLCVTLLQCTKCTPAMHGRAFKSGRLPII
jgi:hypothetical protein